MPRPPRACLVALLLAACHRPSPAPPRDAAPVDAARPATDAPTGRPDTSNDATADAITDAAITDAAADVVAAAPGAVDAACSALTAASLARWDALVRGRRESVPVLYAADRRAEVRRRWECARVAGGAWALSLEARSLAVVFVRPDGSTARVTPPGCAVDPAVPGFLGTALAPQPGAGASPSVVVTCDNGRGAVVSATADGLATSPLPFGDVRVQLSDLDRDGRLDVSTVAEAPGAVVFVAHALPAGGFSMDDEVARIALRGQCPERPSALLVPVPADAPEEDDPNDDDDLARRVACARVWGLSASAIASLLDRDDAGVRTSLPRASLLAIASRRPPQRLRPAALPPMAEVTPAEPVVDAGVTADPVVPAASRAVTAACGAAAARGAAADGGGGHPRGREPHRRRNGQRRRPPRAATDGDRTPVAGALRSDRRGGVGAGAALHRAGGGRRGDAEVPRAMGGGLRDDRGGARRRARAHGAGGRGLRPRRARRLRGLRHRRRRPR
ncbi:MAG: hypothetical protein IPN17_24180 [Deltaproteobacteria bacterium]|nr:hypothetical protein [Deltaproteobacteria bacterium]